jgi:predicted NAD-dependent protein-ADP-ribosyltransferase YbiA (DUF1768 family)
MKIAFRMASPNPLLEGLGAIAEGLTAAPTGQEVPAEVPAEPGAPEPEAAKKKKKERQIPIPKDSATFFRVRAKNLKMFQFTEDGDLQVPEMRGEPAKVIQIPYYRPATAEETLEDEQKSMEAIQEVEREFDETYKLLKRAIAEWRTTGVSTDVIKYQNDMQRLDSQRTQLRSPLRWTKTFKNLSVNKILLTEFYEQRKLGYPVEALKIRTQTIEQSIRADGFTKPAPVAVVAAEEGSDEEEEAPEEFIIFSSPTDPEHGSLSPYTMVEFIHNSTKYNCFLQAYEGERLNMLGRQDIRPTLLKSRSTAQMRVIASRVVGQPPAPRELAISILKSLVSQHSRFADDLRATGTATLVFAEPKDGVLGVGMGVADPQITEKTAWKGTNFLGQAWTAVRAGLPPVADAEDAEEIPAQTGGYTEHGTTLKEAKEKRANVLKGFYRRKF